MHVQFGGCRVAAAIGVMMLVAASAAQGQPSNSASGLAARAEQAMARGKAGAPEAIDLWKRAAALYRTAGDSVNEATINGKVGRAYALVDEPDSALVYLGKGIARDSSATEVAAILSESPLLDPSRSLPEEGAFIERVRNYLGKLTGNDVAAKRVNTVADAHEAIERVSGARLARLRITGDSPGVVVRYIRYTLRDRTGILPEQARTDTTVLRPAVAYRFWYKQATGRDTIVDLQCVNNCDLVVVRGAPPQD